MAWILDEYSKFHGHSPEVVAGKPINAGRVTVSYFEWVQNIQGFMQLMGAFTLGVNLATLLRGWEA
ncbi:ELFV_dehydrog domain-containing protein [Cephalotus follicularis]|uniref:ELFV_dehydrog domain-containing protein n=1 Tax=Cephalotus follicularis TaxID=3775 RepID=A0A1Q3DG33_CEPFO|nr:ELFV_dehydrog domain-containing protein [Cephalotus follicularis]